MDRLWSPWRYRYVSKAEPTDACIFCEKSARNEDREDLILFRGERNFVLLNLYPYTSGHLMVAPYQHVATLEEAPEETAIELMALTRRSQRHLREVYRAPGYNLGMNIGAAAGAGVAGHIHMHVLPRWPGDANFMTTVAETRVVPENLDVAWQKLSEAFRRR
ncbi:MAG: HIT domain-containing protein, partial [Bryobacteraceae bacterium]|nr:HIT domain-containing protein [Bryobacteraceae bacterium]